jgi:hypothetical protein
MADLLTALGFDVDLRTHRIRCLLHGGQNRTSFRWNDNGQWYCFACLARGDKIALVMTVRQCSFGDAVRFLAARAGVHWDGGGISPTEWRELRREQDKLNKAALHVAATERAVRLEYSSEIHALEQLRARAAERLKALDDGVAERFEGEAEFAWSALALVAARLPVVIAGYYVIAFGSAKDRYQFIFNPELRKNVAQCVLERGYVTDDRGGVMEAAV